MLYKLNPNAVWGKGANRNVAVDLNIKTGIRMQRQITPRDVYKAQTHRIESLLGLKFHQIFVFELDLWQKISDKVWKSLQPPGR